MTEPNDTTNLVGVATAIQHGNGTIVICADTLEGLIAYAEQHNHKGAPPARQVIVMLGPEARPSEKANQN
jgi:hypothetical protein